MRLASVVCALSTSALLTGCAVSGGTGQPCTSGLVMNISPAEATADHAQAAPANEVKFQTVVTPTASPGCALPAFAIDAAPAWTNPDPRDITIDSSSNPATNGLATCTGATSGPVTLTAEFTFNNNTLTKTVTLTCK